MLFHPTIVVVRCGNIGGRKLRNELIKYGVFTTKLENLIEHTDNQFIMTNKNSSQNITMSEMKTHVEEVHDHSWEINYDGAQCKFESSSPEDAVIYDLEVPEQARNQGIGTVMVKTAEKIVREKTDAKVMHAQIGASNGSTRHVLHKKCGFEILGEDYRETLGKIIDATKKLD